MRRLLLIVLMFLMPLQWSWSVAASVCAHETGGQATHVGHHEHRHDQDQNHAPASDDVGDEDGAAPAYHADCNVCHGFGTPFLATLATTLAPWSALAVFSEYSVDVPGRTVETLLRPPLTRVG